jgi:hypothetical protein
LLEEPPATGIGGLLLELPLLDGRITTPPGTPGLTAGMAGLDAPGSDAGGVTLDIVKSSKILSRKLFHSRMVLARGLFDGSNAFFRPTVRSLKARG